MRFFSILTLSLFLLAKPLHAECFGPLCHEMHRLSSDLLALTNGGFPTPSPTYDPIQDIRDMEDAATKAQKLVPAGADEKAYQKMFDDLLTELKAYENDPKNKAHIDAIKKIRNAGHEQFKQ